MNIPLDINIKNCLVCDHEGFYSRFNKDNFSIVGCRNCGFVFCNPRYSEESSKLIYNEENWFYGDISKEDGQKRKDYTENQLGLIQRSRQDLSQIEKFKHSGTILDVGCGLGFFLDATRQSGWTIYGIDPSNDAINKCKQKGISNAFVGTLSEVKLPSIQFDVITAFDVLEHVVDPVGFLTQTHSMLASEGILVIAVPNVNSIAARINGKSWSQYILPEHINYFSKNTLTRFLEKNGFKVISVICEPSISLGLREAIRALSSKANSKIFSSILDQLDNSITWFKRFIFYPPINFLNKYVKVEANLLFIIAQKV